MKDINTGCYRIARHNFKEIFSRSKLNKQVSHTYLFVSLSKKNCDFL